jgi:hypothetical protein
VFIHVHQATIKNQFQELVSNAPPLVQHVLMVLLIHAYHVFLISSTKMIQLHVKIFVLMECMETYNQDIVNHVKNHVKIVEMEHLANHVLQILIY